MLNLNYRDENNAEIELMIDGRQGPLIGWITLSSEHGMWEMYGLGGNCFGYAPSPDAALSLFGSYDLGGFSSNGDEPIGGMPW